MNSLKPVDEQQKAQAERLAAALASGTLVQQAAVKDTTDLLITAINLNLRSKMLLEQLLK